MKIFVSVLIPALSPLLILHSLLLSSYLYLLFTFVFILSNAFIVQFISYLSHILPQGENLLRNMKNSSCLPHFGDISVDMDILKGVSCVGALPYLQNFNMRFRPADSRKLIIQITKLLREPDVSECLWVPTHIHTHTHTLIHHVDLYFIHVYGSIYCFYLLFLL